MKNYNFFSYILFVLFLQCKQQNLFKSIPSQLDVIENTNFNNENVNGWHDKDILDDSIPGISLDKAIKLVLKKEGKQITIALLDSEVDINHEAIKKHVWINNKETPNNGLDDDKNGYIDDINGWNFLGNNLGQNIINANYEYVRIVRDSSLKQKDSLVYFSNLNFYKKKIEAAKSSMEYSNKVYSNYIEARNALVDYFPEYNYNLETLNSIDTIGNNLHKHVEEIRLAIKYNETDESNKKINTFFNEDFNERLNLNFNERSILNENSNDLADIKYGNNSVSSNIGFYKHGTKTASLIVAENVRIMPLCVSPSGDEHDKDIALAIKYAVNNGAKVINMSFGKRYSLKKQWVLEAIKYAAENNVLIITSSGNEGLDLNIEDYFPNDNLDNGVEVSDNFLMVGASTQKISEDLFANYSNYGNFDVDIFAPGDKIKVAIPKNEYSIDSGTSLAAALTSKVAALIFSYYPNLTASQVKHIIMDSGVEYTFPVKTPTKEDKDKMTPFNELSKSGKIVNAYNALIMADSFSKVSKRKLM